MTRNLDFGTVLVDKRHWALLSTNDINSDEKSLECRKSFNSSESNLRCQMQFEWRL